MPGYDWPLLADRGGESIEGLIATFLRRLYPTARQINPSQGDGGVDVILESDEGVTVWQIKKYTSPITPSQWANIKRSWNRFIQEHVGDGKPVIVRYVLVTPWTPTDEKYADFRDLTADAAFPAQWDGEAFVNGLADQYSDTMDRFLNGPNNFERFVTQRALIAGSPIERSNETNMLQAIELRQNALDDFRATMSDNYRIEHGTRTVREYSDPPMPPAGDAGVFHRMVYLGENRWSIDSVVPTTANSMELEPINVEVTFLDPPGTPEHQAVRDWLEWGIPFKDVRARTVQTGGPFGGETHDDSHLSFVAVSSRTYPAIFMRVTKDDGSVRLYKPLRTVEVTHGASTGWLRLVVESTNKILRMEFRSKSVERPEVVFTVGHVEGLAPTDVLHELDEFLSIEQSDTFVIDIEGGAMLLRGTGMSSPAVMADFYRPVAAGLASLQASTVYEMLMPNVLEIRMGQFESLKQYVSIYDGNARIWTWETVTVQVPDSPEDAEDFKTQLRQVLAGEIVPTIIERPTIELADSEYLIQRPIVTTRHSFRAHPDLDIDSLQPGQGVELLPGDDNRVTTAAVVDWSPDNDVNI